MADGDKIYKSIPAKYRKFFQQVIEGIWSSEDLGKEALKPLQKDISCYGNIPIDLIYEVYNKFLIDIDEKPLFRSLTSWREAIKFMERLRVTMQGHKIGLNLADQAVREEIQKMDKGGEFPVDILESIIVSYFYKIYQHNFAGRMPLISSEDPNFDLTFTNMRLKEIEPHLINNLSGFAKQVMYGKDVTSLVLPRIKRSQSNIDLETNIFDLFETGGS